MIVWVIVVLLSGYSFAEQVNALRFKSAFSSNAFLVEDGIDGYQGLGLEYKGIFSLSYEQGDNIISVVENGAETKLFDIVERFSRYRLSGGYFISKNYFLGITIPFDQISSRQPFIPGGDNSNIGSQPFQESNLLLGDIGIKLKSRFKKEDIWNLTYGLALYLPTGDEQWFNTDDSVGIGIDLSFTRYLNSAHTLRSYGSLGYLNTNNSRLEISDRLRVLDTRQRVNLGLGLGYDLNRTWNVFGEIAVQIGLPFENFQNPLAFNLGGRYRFGQYQAFAGIGVESLFDSDHSENRFFAGIQYMFGRKNEKEVKQVQQEKKKELSKEGRAIKVLRDAGMVIGNQNPTELSDLLHFSRGIEFQTGLAEIIPIYFSELDEIARVIKINSDKIEKIKIIGHTDSSGLMKRNDELSLLRAVVVRDYFVKKWKISQSKFDVYGKGSREPMVKEVDIMSKNLNRRVEFYIEKVK